MVRFLGAVMIIIPSCVLGFFFADHYKRRRRCLNDFITALKMIEAEIEYSQTPLPEIFNKLKEKLNNESSRFFEEILTVQSSKHINYQNAWLEVLEQKDISFLPLTSQDLKILMNYGHVMGQSDRGSQIKQLQLTLKMLSRQENEAHEYCKRYVRLWRYMGLLMGVFLVLLLL